MPYAGDKRGVKRLAVADLDLDAPAAPRLRRSPGEDSRRPTAISSSAAIKSLMVRFPDAWRAKQNGLRPTRMRDPLPETEPDGRSRAERFVFVLAGAVKGIIGLGLPTVALGLPMGALD